MSISKGGVVVFASNDPRSGTERLVIVAETSVTAPELLEEVRTAINAVTMDLLGTPADDIVLTAPKTVLKTSSGKIRRAANRELYECGWHGKPRSAVWWQVMRIALEGVKPRIRRTLHRLLAGLYAGCVWLLFGAIVPLLWVSIVVLPRPSWSWAVGRGAARFLRWACGIALNVHCLENLPADRSFVLVANHSSYIEVAHLCHAAADDYCAWVEEIDQTGDRNADIPAGALDNFLGGEVAAPGCLSHIQRGRE